MGHQPFGKGYEAREAWATRLPLMTILCRTLDDCKSATILNAELDCVSGRRKSHMRLAEIQWGDDSAEKDPFLLEYFVTSDAFRRVRERTKNIVVGRKGSGKSA